MYIHCSHILSPFYCCCSFNLFKRLWMLNISFWIVENWHLVKYGRFRKWFCPLLNSEFPRFTLIRVIYFLPCTLCGQIALDNDICTSGRPVEDSQGYADKLWHATVHCQSRTRNLSGRWPRTHEDVCRCRTQTFRGDEPVQQLTSMISSHLSCVHWN